MQRRLTQLLAYEQRSSTMLRQGTTVVGLRFQISSTAVRFAFPPFHLQLISFHLHKWIY